MSAVELCKPKDLAGRAAKSFENTGQVERGEDDHGAESVTSGG